MPKNDPYIQKESQTNPPPLAAYTAKGTTRKVPNYSGPITIRIVRIFLLGRYTNI